MPDTSTPSGGPPHFKQARRQQPLRSRQLDRAAQSVLARQADQVRFHRRRLADIQDHLAELSRTSRTLATIPGLGEAMRTEFEMAAVSAAIETGSRQLQLLTARVDENSVELYGIAGEYTAVTRPGVEPRDGEDEPSRDVPRPLEPGDEGDGTSSEDATGPDDGTLSAAMPIPAGWSPLTPVPAAPELTQQPGALPTDPAAGLESVFGMVGGMIGAVVAPLAAALTGVAGAAGESLSLLTEAGGGDRLDSGRDATRRDTADPLAAGPAEGTRHRDAEEHDPEANPDGAEDRDVPSTADPSADAAAPAEVLAPDPAPAPIRPPQDRAGGNP